MIALLDTHVLLYWFGPRHEMDPAQMHVIEAATAESPLLVSDISLWEIATLVQLGRVTLNRSSRDWLELATAPPLVRRVGISPSIAAQVAALPVGFHRDPADRILVATAQVMGATLLTSDRRIRDSGIVATL